MGRNESEGYQPTKTVLAWSCVGSIVATLIVGFTWGGWVTGGTAAEMAATAAEEARTEVAAAVCVNKFISSADAGAHLAELKAASSWERDGVIEDGGWSTIKGYEGNLDNVADVCGDQLASMEALPEAAATPVATETDDI